MKLQNQWLLENSLQILKNMLKIEGESVQVIKKMYQHSSSQWWDWTIEKTLFSVIFSKKEEVLSIALKTKN
jgi:uncharacterized protein YcaQ